MIETKNLHKSFKSYKKEPGIKGALKSFFQREYTLKNAVENFNLEIKPGEIVGLLGPNGAGKTTLMKMFTGIIVPSKGELRVLGYEPHKRDKEFRKKIALVMGQKSQLWWDIPAMDSFLLLQKYYEIPEVEFKRKIHEMSTLLDVEKLLHIHVRKLSLGERMKLELMASLLHNPDIIFLDEPTIGLDLISQEKIRNFIKKYHKENNISIILTSHYMADVAELCQRLVLIMDGKKKYDGAIEDFEKILGQEKSVTFDFTKEQNTEDPYWTQFSGVWNKAKNQVELKIPQDRLCETSIEILGKYPVKEFSTHKLPIEKVMKELMSNPEILKATHD